MLAVAASAVVRGADQQAVTPPAAPAPAAPVARHTRAWTRSIEAPGVAAVAVSEKFLAVAGPETPLAVYGAADGAPAWSSTLRTNLPPVFAGDVLAICSETAVVALRAATGELAWHVTVAGVSATALLATASSLLLVTPEGVQAWKLDGTVLWDRRMPTANARAAVGPAAIYVPVPGPAIATLDLATGEVVATLPAASDTRYIAVQSDRLLVSSTAGDLSAYKIAPVLKRDWHWRAIEATGPPVADARSVYASLIDNTLYAYALGNGNQRWTRQLSTRPRGAPVVFEGRVMVVLADGQLAQYRTDGASIADEPPAPGSTRIISVGAAPSGALIAAIGVPADESRQLIAWRPAPDSR